jgi:hypothetical protein
VRAGSSLDGLSSNHAPVRPSPSPKDPGRV